MTPSQGLYFSKFGEIKTGIFKEMELPVDSCRKDFLSNLDIKRLHQIFIGIHGFIHIWLEFQLILKIIALGVFSSFVLFFAFMFNARLVS